MQSIHYIHWRNCEFSGFKYETTEQLPHSCIPGRIQDLMADFLTEAGSDEHLVVEWFDGDDLGIPRQVIRIDNPDRG